ncbi:MAG: hypothetical protein E7678_00670 [Ruminococcaceae bacterium]|nr:hypothetical protein [Oscillospiraceae bacterium]
MEKFKKNIKQKFIVTTIAYIVMFSAAIILSMLNAFEILTPVTGDTAFCGGLIGGGVVMLGHALNYRKGLKNEEKLKELYIKDTDERSVVIYKSTYSLASYLLVILMLIAAIIFAYINSVICYTLLTVLIVFAILISISSLYYNKKY